MGIIGAGLATQAVHLPVLMRCADQLRTIAIASRDLDTAAQVATRVGAAALTDVDLLLADPNVEVVAVCSPDDMHAQHVVAACEAGKKVVFCEKPLTTSYDQLASIEDAARANGTRLVVGAMLSFDDAWRSALIRWRDQALTATFVRSTMFLPLNPTRQARVEDLLPRSPRPPNDLSSPQGRYNAFSGSVLGLATHALPLVHSLMPGLTSVTDARWLMPWGYAITLSDGRRAAELLALMPGPWETDWAFEAWSGRDRMLIASPPAFVHAGSSRATFEHDGDIVLLHSEMNGYESQWRHVADVARGSEPSVALDDVIAETRLALDIIDGARAYFEGAA